MNKKGDYQPLFIGLIIFLILAVVLSLFIIDFNNVMIDLEPQGALTNVIDFVDDGIGISFLNFSFFGFNTDLGGNFNIFDFLPDFVQSYIIGVLALLSLIPNYILIPFLILFVLGMAYTILKILPFT